MVLDSAETPLSWSNICQNASEKVTNEQYDRARTWHEGEKGTKEVPDEDSDNIDDVNTECEQAREPLILNAKDHEKTRRQYVSGSSLSKKSRE